MKRLAAIFLLFGLSMFFVLLPGQAYAFSTIKLVQKSGGFGGGATTCSFDNNVQAGDTVFVLVGGSSANGAVSDSLGNIYTQAKTFAAAGATQGANAAIYYSILTAIGPDVVTVAQDSDNKGQGTFCLELSGGWSLGTAITASGTMSASTTTFSVASTSEAAGDTILVATGENVCGGGTVPIVPIFNATALPGNGNGVGTVACNGGTLFSGSGGHLLSGNWGGGASTFSASMTSSTAINTNSANWAEIMLPLIPSVITSTTVSSTVGIIGWNVPSAVTFGNGLIELLFPIICVALFAAIPLMLDQRGDFVVTMALLGNVVGHIIGMLSETAIAPTNVPFASLFLSIVMFGLWLWRGALGGGH